MEHTEYIDALIARMKSSYDSGSYFESITISYAILEDRVLALLKKINSNSMDVSSLFDKSLKISEYVHDSFYNNHPTWKIKHVYKKLEDDNTFESIKKPVLKIKKKYKNNRNNPIDLLSEFRVQRNQLIHKLATFEENVTDYNSIIQEAKEVAKLGNHLVHRFSNLNNKIKVRVDN